MSSIICSKMNESASSESDQSNYILLLEVGSVLTLQGHKRWYI